MLRFLPIISGDNEKPSRRDEGHIKQNLESYVNYMFMQNCCDFVIIEKDALWESKEMLDYWQPYPADISYSGGMNAQVVV